MSTLNILDANTEQQITDMGDALDTIDFAGLIAALDVPTATANFSALTTALQDAIDAIDASGASGLGATRVCTAKVHVINICTILF